MIYRAVIKLLIWLTAALVATADSATASAPVRPPRHMGIMDSSGKVILQPECHVIKRLGPNFYFVTFSDRKAHEGAPSQIFDNEGRKVDVQLPSGFHIDAAFAKRAQPAMSLSDLLCVVTDGNRTGLMDGSGWQILEPHENWEFGDYYDGFFVVTERKLIPRNPKEPCMADSYLQTNVYIFDDHGVRQGSIDEEKFFAQTPFSDGVLCATRRYLGDYAYLLPSGKQLNIPVQEVPSDFHENFVAAHIRSSRSSPVSLFDKSGSALGHREFTSASDMKEGSSVVSIGTGDETRFGVLTKIDEWLFKPQYEQIRRVSNGNFFVLEQDKRWSEFDSLGRRARAFPLNVEPYEAYGELVDCEIHPKGASKGRWMDPRAWIDAKGRISYISDGPAKSPVPAPFWHTDRKAMKTWAGLRNCFGIIVEPKYEFIYYFDKDRWVFGVEPPKQDGAY